MEPQNNNKKKIIILILAIVTFIFLCAFVFFYFVSPVNNNKESLSFNVKQGENYSSISDELKDAKLIKSEMFYKLYLKFMNPENLEAGNYKLSKSMNLKEVIKTLSSGATTDRQTVTVTFVEGKNMRYVIEKLIENFGFSEEDILNKLKDDTFLSNLIKNHWIVGYDVKDENIYYSLEGYLFPDTYEFYKDSSIEDVFEKMITNLEKKMNPYKDEIEATGYSFHNILTLASIIEQEAGTSNDRKGVAGVFYNRLNDNWSLGSDVTTYYAEKIELWSRDLYKTEIKECNYYNTRAVCMAGRLPVGPICSVSIDSIIASIEPTESDYYYFVSDIYGVTYFNKTESGHSKTIDKLKSEGKWFQY